MSWVKAMCQATLMHEHESGCDCGLENTWPRVGQVSNQLVLGVLHICQTKLGGLRGRCKQFGGLNGDNKEKKKREGEEVVRVRERELRGKESEKGRR